MLNFGWACDEPWSGSDPTALLSIRIPTATVNAGKKPVGATEPDICELSGIQLLVVYLRHHVFYLLLHPLPRIEDEHFCRLEIGHIANDYRPAMNKGR